jgi:hypothetical protein
MKTALARRNEWARQLRLMQEERKRLVEDEPEGKFMNTSRPVKDALRSDKLSHIIYQKRR